MGCGVGVKTSSQVRARTALSETPPATCSTEMIEMAGLDRDLEQTLGDVALGSGERCELGVFASSVR
jgi:hypothetical protein